MASITCPLTPKTRKFRRTIADAAGGRAAAEKPSTCLHRHMRRSTGQQIALAASLRRARQLAPHVSGPSWEAHAVAQELRRWLGPTKGSLRFKSVLNELRSPVWAAAEELSGGTGPSQVYWLGPQVGSWELGTQHRAPCASQAGRGRPEIRIQAVRAPLHLPAAAARLVCGPGRLMHTLGALTCLPARISSALAGSSGQWLRSPAL